MGMQSIVEVLRQNTLLSALTDSTLESVLPELNRIALKAGDVLFNMGDSGDSYYIVESGVIKITSPDVTLSRLSAGESFGEMALLNNQPRSASAIAETDAHLIGISRTGFLHLMEKQPDLVEAFQTMMQKLMRRSLLATAFNRLCGELDESVIGGIESELVWETYAPGDILLKQGDEGQDALMIISGRVRATIENGEGKRVLGEVGGGSIVGEMSLLSEAPRSATITAIRETRVARMNRAVFSKIMHSHSDFALRLMRTMVERQRQNFEQSYVEKPTTLNITIMPISEGVDVLAFAKGLSAYLEKHGSTLVIDREAFVNLYGLKNEIDYTHPTSFITQLWLDELERRYDYVLYVTDASWTSWTHWVSGSADRVLLVGEAQGDAGIGELERTLIEEVNEQRRELVLLHEPDTKRPSGTMAWLKERNLYRHHHVRKGDEAHLARVARLLTGHGIGFVLSGGGARGYAHLGVIKALMEAQVPIDAIGATSMGSLIGGALLTYLDYDAIKQKAMKLGSRKAILDFTMPVSALMRSKKVTNVVSDLYGDLRIEDGWLPFFCVSANLSKAKLEVHTEGQLTDAVRASLSIPGVFSPVVRDDDLLIDGGVMNNYPVDIMREWLEGGKIIGTLVTGRESKGRPYKIDDYIDGWRVFLRNIIPGIRRQRVPSILKVILGATSVNSSQALTAFQKQTDLLLQTDTYPYSMLDFDEYKALEERGYDTHLEVIRTWAKAHQHLIEQPPMWAHLDERGQAV